MTHHPQWPRPPRRLALAAAALLTAGACMAQPATPSFDVLGSVMDTTQTEINAKKALDMSVAEALAFRDRILAGFWDFFQSSSTARPGEFCTATFVRAHRVPMPSGIDLFDRSVMVSLLGPGGDYKGALIGLAPLDDSRLFSGLTDRQKVLVTLQQGDEAPVTLHGLYMAVGAKKLPQIMIVVPTMEALLGSIEDTWRMRLSYQGQLVADITWHSGLKARDELKRCLAKKS